MTPPRTSQALQTTPVQQPSDTRAADDAAFRKFTKTRDPALRDRLVTDHLWIARHAARRFSGRGVERDDLMQVASMALVKAVDRFDPERQVRFASFAMPTVVGELRRHFRDKTWAVRVPRRLTDLHVSLRVAREELEQILGRAPTVDELAEQVDATAEDVLEALEAGNSYRSMSIDLPAQDDDRESAIVPIDDEALEGSDERLRLVEALGTLTEREQRIVCMSVFAEHTQSEIAEVIGVSQVHISRLLRAALDKLRDALAEDPELVS